MKPTIIILLVAAIFGETYGSVYIECPYYVTVNRNASSASIFCTIIYPTLEQAEKSSRFVWWNVTISTVSNGSNTSSAETYLLPSGETNGRFTFNATNSSNIVTTQLTIDPFDPSSDYQTFTFVSSDPEAPKSFAEAKVELKEGTKRSRFYFKWWDYVIFLGSLALYAGIGGYYVCVNWQRVPPDGDYILGDRRTNWFNSTWSLYRTFLSALPVLCGASEIYAYGTQYMTACFAYPISCYIAVHVMLPIFYKLKVTSVHEYLEKRFSKAVRVACSAVFIIQMVIYMSMVIYAPSIALEQTIGLSFWLFALTGTLCCIFYTSIAGLAANNWIDVIQGVGMFVGTIAILARGASIEGGLVAAFEKVRSQNRVQFFEISPDPRFRNSFWTTTIGMSITFLYTYGVAQTQVEVGLMAGTLRDAKIAGWLNVLLNILLLMLPALIGLLASAHYRDCDPVSAGYLSSVGKILVYYVMDVVVEDCPGLAGLFTASLCCAALSGISCGLTALVATTCRDFGIDAFMKQVYLTKNRMSHASKAVSAFYGCLCLVLVLPIQNFPMMLDTINTIFGALGGPVLGVFLCGIFLPWINAVGVFLGLILAIAVTVWNGVGFYFQPDISAALPTPAFSTMGCDWADAPYDFDNTTTPVPSYTPAKEVNFSKLTWLDSFYAISYLYLSLIGIIIVVIVGAVVSAIMSLAKGRLYSCENPDLINQYVLKLIRWTRRLRGIDEFPLEEVPHNKAVSTNKPKQQNRSDNFYQRVLSRVTRSGQTDIYQLKPDNGTELKSRRIDIYKLTGRAIAEGNVDKT